MTPEPVCIGPTETLTSASERMKSAKIRRLPVLDRGKLVGLLSQRDVLFAETGRDFSSEKSLVKDAMTPDAYVVPPQRTIGEVAAKMVEQKFGCAVVAREGHVVGIFTTNDALRVLSGIVEAWL